MPQTGRRGSGDGVSAGAISVTGSSKGCAKPVPVSARSSLRVGGSAGRDDEDPGTGTLLLALLSQTHLLRGKHRLPVSQCKSTPRCPHSFTSTASTSADFLVSGNILPFSSVSAPSPRVAKNAMRAWFGNEKSAGFRNFP